MSEKSRAYIGILGVRIKIDSAFSLKDKRHVIKSVMEKVRNKFKFSASEVGDMDILNLSSLAFVCVSNSYSHAEERIEKVISFLEEDYRYEFLDIYTEINSWSGEYLNIV